VTADQENAICAVINRFAFGFDERKLDMVETCFAEHAQMTMCIAGGDLIGPFVGRKDIMQLMSDTLAGQTDQRRHVMSNILCQSGEENNYLATSYLTLFSISNDQVNVISTGVYSDEIEQEEGEWKLVKRHLELDLSY
jgi:hypothetical protein